MRYAVPPSFEKTFQKLIPQDKKVVKGAIRSLISFYETGQRPVGLGLKKLTEDIWEIRAGIRLRILFTIEGDLLSWCIVGSHDQIVRFLKSV
ncbi:MAG: hypothetical protein COX46_05870 [bacterium (Candidatus Ratteibacteria) CG23_combo_of_CG06-09_8_20_14_all_48_7]|uniref:Cytotoxin n=1 Tax=bacterium (Candidatus Ratteibacteria) CG23_combo_of_CG06-09_8_20_14_all_48_7 TaxID=2014292 RepID=A0A2G9Y883_9BACT|nr:MAG: hypothetical protein COX46_05870 [bacterium (Candidatus Ratteibacteria) CG23_combo_of_CG06-09_8_20_14_all_48_7]